MMSSAYLTTIPSIQNISSLSLEITPAADRDAHESLEAAMLELGQRCSEYARLRDQLHARLEQLRSNKQELRRRRSRSFVINIPTPVSFYSIEQVN